MGFLAVKNHLEPLHMLREFLGKLGEGLEQRESEDVRPHLLRHPLGGRVWELLRRGRATRYQVSPLILGETNQSHSSPSSCQIVGIITINVLVKYTGHIELPKAQIILQKNGGGPVALATKPLIPEFGTRPLIPESGTRPLIPEFGTRPLIPESGTRPLIPEFGTRLSRGSCLVSKDLVPHGI